MWQDFVLTATNVIFGLALIPALRAEEKPALKTCAITAATLFVTAATSVTLGLWFTAGCVCITGTLWAILGIQSYRRTKRGHR